MTEGSLHRGDAVYGRYFRDSVDKVFDDLHSPYSHASLQGSQLSVREIAMAACLQTFEHGFRFHVRLFF